MFGAGSYPTRGLWRRESLSPFAGVKRFLKGHPVVCLLLLSPGIPEYLSSSSPINALVLNPSMFAFQIVANLGLYGPGVLLVREASLRWKKGLATVLLLGAAYGILEEGIALSTLFNPEAGPVGLLGVYGHWAGVNWIWVAIILPVHMIYSMALPILLLGMALPRTRGVSFLGGRKAGAALVILGADVAGLFFAVWKTTQFWMGWPVFLGSWAAIVMLVVAARRAHADALRPMSELPKVGPVVAGLVGAVFYPAVLLSAFVPASAGVPAAADLVFVTAVQGVFLTYVMWVIGRERNERVLLSLSFGLIVPIAVIGVVSEAALPMTLVADAAMVLFFLKLWRMYPTQRQVSELAEPVITKNGGGEDPSGSAPVL
jgi:hypothetical protein